MNTSAYGRTASIESASRPLSAHSTAKPRLAQHRLDHALVDDVVLDDAGSRPRAARRRRGAAAGGDRLGSRARPSPRRRSRAGARAGPASAGSGRCRPRAPRRGGRSVDVSITRRAPRSDGASEIACASSIPSMPGIWPSSTTSSNGSPARAASCIGVSASGPEAAVAQRTSRVARGRPRRSRGWWRCRRRSSTFSAGGGWRTRGGRGRRRGGRAARRAGR